jgi:hypothetical protein
MLITGDLPEMLNQVVCAYNYTSDQISVLYLPLLLASGRTFLILYYTATHHDKSEKVKRYQYMQVSYAHLIYSILILLQLTRSSQR